MTIQTRYGNLLDVPSGIILHGCNAQGVMGSGVAKQIRERFPEAYHTYHMAASEGRLNPGTVTWANVGKNLWVVNAITQQWYGRDGQRYVSYDALVQCCEKINRLNKNDHPVHFPMIGAGLGGGNWEIIGAILDHTLRASEKNLWLPE